MIIGGFQKNSLIDFPGTIACVIFTQGCNFTCPYCHNPDLVAGPPRKGAGPVYDEQKIFEFLEKRKGLLEGVVITGGEPTLQKDIIPFCRQVKDLGYKIKLDTNGTGPRLLQDLLNEKLPDYVAMDIKTSLDQYDRIWPVNPDPRKIKKSIELIMAHALDYEFRTTCARPFVSRLIMKDIGKMIRGARAYHLQQCSRNVNVLDPEFLKSKDSFFSNKQLKQLSEIVAPDVETITIR